VGIKKIEKLKTSKRKDDDADDLDDFALMFKKGGV
jgi:hypothetical protein